MVNKNADEILKELNIDDEVIAIFPYGSRVYGTADSKSDYDYIIVTKGAFLESNAFKDNAISNKDRTIQGILYSRSGFLNALEKYEIGALESLSIDKEDVVLMKPIFKKFIFNRQPKWDNKEMVRRIIQKASASWYIATQQFERGQNIKAKKGIFHAIRILSFGLQLKECGKIVDFGECNEFYYKLKSVPPDEFNFKRHLKRRNDLMKKLREF